LKLPEHATTDYRRWREWGENHGPDIYILVSVRTAFNCHLPRCVQTLECLEHRQDAPHRMQHLWTVEGRSEGIADARRYKWLVFACSGSVNLYFISTFSKHLVLDEDICCQNASNLKRISELCAISAFQQPLSHCQLCQWNPELDHTLQSCMVVTLRKLASSFTFGFHFVHNNH
jgi:hypothetical protein